MRKSLFPVAVALALVSSLFQSPLLKAQQNSPQERTLDFRYAPCDWQTAICLPDDWQKTLVRKDGTLLYDYAGKNSGFGLKITPGVAGESTWKSQRLVDARTPIVQTFKSAGPIEIVEETFAVAPLVKGKQVDSTVQRLDGTDTQLGWAAAATKWDPAFRNIAVGWKHPIQYRFAAKANQRYQVVFGLCEGHHDKPAQRILDLQLEGKTRRTVDLVAENGRNIPGAYLFETRDEDGDGWIDLAVAASEKSVDVNTILSVFWVFSADKAPALEKLLTGRGGQGALLRVDASEDCASDRPPRNDLVTVRYRNTGSSNCTVAPTLAIETDISAKLSENRRQVMIGASTKVMLPQSCTREERSEGKLVLFFPERSLAAGADYKLAFGVTRGQNAQDLPKDFAQAENLRGKAEQFWKKGSFPYGHLEVPDQALQGLLDSCVRNIYQAREIKKGLPAFQVGPTCYRGLWVVDGSFLLEAITYLGRTNETRSGVRYLMNFQREDGSFLLINGHWKETGIALWVIARHAELTGDKAWLAQAWPNVQRGFAFIRKMRAMPEVGAPNAGLIPDGYSDGGISGKIPEYTNIYWTLAGMRAAIAAARSLGRNAEADEWQKEFDDFYRVFRAAAERDTREDAQGNRYVPIKMKFDPNVSPQRGQWAFMHAIYPGKLFSTNDALVRGNMAMLKAVEKQGLIQDTGWLKDGIWTYFGGFYGNAWLWLGDGEKASEVLYAFGNHASPLLVWREEQELVGRGAQFVGDMPHNWASAEFIRLVRHSLVLERGNELHLLEAMPAKWVYPGAKLAVRDVLTEFGPISMELRVAKDGKTARLNLAVPQRNKPEKVVLHLDHWSGKSGVMELPAGKRLEKVIELTR